MSIILAIETSTELASAALLDGERLFFRETTGVSNHSQTILPMVQALLAEAGLTLADCDAIGFGLGPGSFTGVRTACGIAQGLAFGSNLPVVPVVTLLAMAHACHEATGACDVLALLDARMGEVYWAQYRYAGGWQEIVAPRLSLPSEVQPHGTVQACGAGLLAYAEQFSSALWLTNIANEANEVESASLPHARSIARLAQVDLTAGKQLPAAQAQPLYLRNKVAETTLERQHKAAAR